MEKEIKSYGYISKINTKTYTVLFDSDNGQKHKIEFDIFPHQEIVVGDIVGLKWINGELKDIEFLRFRNFIKLRMLYVRVRLWIAVIKLNFKLKGE